MGDAKAVLRAIREHQLAWAESRELELDETAHVSELHANLFAPLSQATYAELAGSIGCPLGDGAKPAPMQALDSTVALICNVFDYWRERSRGALLAACGGDPAAGEIGFAQALPGLETGGRCEIDVLLHGEGARPTALMTSFTEPYREPDASLPAAWLEDPDIWAELPACQALARDLRCNPRRYRHLPVPRLLAWSQALTRRYGPRGFRLVYLWLDMPGHAARDLRREIDRLRMRVGGEVDLRARSWQSLYADLQPARHEHTRYLDYLATRYL